VAQVGAVVTAERSDWSVAPVPGWAGRDVTVRVSRSGDALTVRARADADSWQLVRVAPLPPGDLLAGPFCCAPTRAGLVVRFRSAVLTAADASLHA
jgi:regulation of enolase protein 1 (concanavalin A-like superfamily)